MEHMQNIDPVIGAEGRLCRSEHEANVAKPGGLLASLMQTATPSNPTLPTSTDYFLTEVTNYLCTPIMRFKRTLCLTLTKCMSCMLRRRLMT